jgi:hypothetical protein
MEKRISATRFLFHVNQQILTRAFSPKFPNIVDKPPFLT